MRHGYIDQAKRSTLKIQSLSKVSEFVESIYE